MTSFAHIINPVSNAENAELFKIQSLTFESILKAARYNTAVPLELLTVSTHGSIPGIPAEFRQLPALTRSIADFVNPPNRNYPILGDIIQTAARESKAEFIVFTNLDICLMPFFYEAVQHYISQGHDAIVINRRRIKDRFARETKLEALYAEAGKDHTGYDCFVIKRELIGRFIFKTICIGAPPAGNELFYNIFAFAQKPVLFTEKHLTFHVGLDLVKNWGNSAIVKHNYTEWKQLLKELLPMLKADLFPAADLRLVKRHFKWLMNPTLHYPTMLKLDARRGFKRTRKATTKHGDHWYYEWLIKQVNFRDE